MTGNNSESTTVKSDESSAGGVENGTIFSVISACQVVEIAMLLFSIWILLCAIIYGYKTKKWRKKPGSSSLDQGKMYSCCIAAIALTLPRIIFTCVLLFVHPDILSPICEAMMDISNGLYIAATYPAYFYLWLRQRAIYCHPAAQKLAGKCVILSGWVVLLILTGLSVVLGWAFIAPDSYTSSPIGCIIHTNINRHQHWYYGLASLFAAAQLSLLTFFIYPMVRCGLDQIKNRSTPLCVDGKQMPQAKRMSAYVVCRKILCGEGDRNSEQGSSLRKTIRRSVYGALVAIISDITVMLIVSFGVPHATPRMITDTLYDVSILINSLGILATFGNNINILKACWSSPKDYSDNRRKSQDTTQSNFIQSGDGSRW